MATDRLSTSATRRAILSAAAAVPTLALAETVTSSCTAKAATIDANRPAEDAAETFATAWLDMWTSSGGSMMYYDGEWTIGFLDYTLSPAHKAAQARLTGSEYFRSLDPAQPADKNMRDSLERRAHGWEDAAYFGRMRAMRDMLDAFPAGKEAVKAIILQSPQRGYVRREA